jgi:glycosyltransferase involved in cell wall biosynthesis
MPTVAFNTGVTEYEPIRHEENGLLVNVGDSEQLSRAVVRIASDKELWADMSSESRKVVKEYGLHRVIDTYNDIYHELLCCRKMSGRRQSITVRGS